ncbi:MAG TPA: hypothetical protein QF630_05535, partial [Alphaproteobacteria bacterium]|nr:hypothetical protein [Alphaproteobacteria bacterium]
EYSSEKIELGIAETAGAIGGKGEDDSEALVIDGFNRIAADHAEIIGCPFLAKILENRKLLTRLGAENAAAHLRLAIIGHDFEGAAFPDAGVCVSGGVSFFFHAARRAPPNQAETLVEGMKNPRGAEAALNLNAVGGQSRAKSFDHHLGGIALQALLNDPARERFVIGQAAFGFADESCHDPQKEYVVRPAIVTLTASNLASKIALQCPINAAFT